MKKFILMVVLLHLFGAAQAQWTSEQEKIKQIFFNFLKYYQQNEKKFNTYVLYKGKGNSQGPPYRVQWKEVEKYFNFLRSNVPFVGEAYIAAERKHFQFSDSCFKANPTEEMAVGFDYDRWAGGQEHISYTIGWYTSKKNTYQVNIVGNKAELRIGSPLQEGEMEADRTWSIVPFVKEKGVWKMADNIYPTEY